jgi:hypothetical protein
MIYQTNKISGWEDIWSRAYQKLKKPSYFFFPLLKKWLKINIQYIHRTIKETNIFQLELNPKKKYQLR